MVDHHIELGPGPELSFPVGDGGERGNDQEWPLNALHVDLIEECYGLDGLPQAHLISQDTVTSAGGCEKKEDALSRTGILEISVQKGHLAFSVPETDCRAKWRVPPMALM